MFVIWLMLETYQVLYKYLMSERIHQLHREPHTKGSLPCAQVCSCTRGVPSFMCTWFIQYLWNTFYLPVILLKTKKANINKNIILSMKECTDYKRNQTSQTRLATKCSGCYNRSVSVYPSVGGHREVVIPDGPESWAQGYSEAPYRPPPHTHPIMEYM